MDFRVIIPRTAQRLLPGTKRRPALCEPPSPSSPMSAPGRTATPCSEPDRQAGARWLSRSALSIRGARCRALQAGSKQCMSLSTWRGGKGRRSVHGPCGLCCPEGTELGACRLPPGLATSGSAHESLVACTIPRARAWRSVLDDVRARGDGAEYPRLAEYARVAWLRWARWGGEAAAEFKLRSTRSSPTTHELRPCVRNSVASS